MTSIDIDTRQLDRLVVDLGKVAGRLVPMVAAVTEQHGQMLAEQWRTNAIATSGEHGRMYPYSITAELTYTPGFTGGGITAVAGPEYAKKQGGLGPGFEYGSVNQPPHLDGARAADVVGPKYLAGLTAALARALA